MKSYPTLNCHSSLQFPGNITPSFINKSFDSNYKKITDTNDEIAKEIKDYQCQIDHFRELIDHETRIKEEFVESKINEKKICDNICVKIKEINKANIELKGKCDQLKNDNENLTEYAKQINEKIEELEKSTESIKAYKEKLRRFKDYTDKCKKLENEKQKCYKDIRLLQESIAELNEKLSNADSIIEKLSCVN